MVPVAVADQYVIDLLDVLIDQRLVDLDRSLRVELASENPVGMRSK